MMRENKFMKRASALALQRMRTDRGGPFGAVIVRHGEIVAEGWNAVTSTNDPTAHAEIVAIRRACAALGVFHLQDCEIYASCEPCPMCLGAIYWAKLQRLYFANTRFDAARIGFDDEFIYREIATEMADRSIPSRQMQSAGAQRAFREWTENPDKVRY